MEWLLAEVVVTNARVVIVYTRNAIVCARADVSSSLSLRILFGCKGTRLSRPTYGRLLGGPKNCAELAKREAEMERISERNREFAR